MVWQGLKRAQAAESAGLKDHSLYVALTHPHVKAYYLQQCEVLRTSERARNIHRLIEIREAADNMPAVHAIRDLMAEPDQTLAARAQQLPGFTIVINAGAAHQQMRDVTPVLSDVTSEGDASSNTSNIKGMISDNTASPSRGKHMGSNDDTD